MAATHEVDQLIDGEGRQVGAYSAGIPIAVSDLSAQILELTGG